MVLCYTTDYDVILPKVTVVGYRVLFMSKLNKKPSIYKCSAPYIVYGVLHIEMHCFIYIVECSINVMIHVQKQ